jgi:putative hemolysin
MSPEVLLGIPVSLFFTFFFPGIEYAFLASNKPQIIVTGKQGALSGKIMTYAVQRTAWFITATRSGYFMSLCFFCFFAAKLLTQSLSNYLPGGTPVIVLALVIISTLIILFTVELITKSLFVINPNKMISAMAIPFAIFFFVLSPLVFVQVILVKFVTIRIFGKKYSEENPPFTLTNLSTYFKGIHGVKYEAKDLELDKKIFRNALEFKTVRVRECLVPRTEIIAVGLDEGIEKLRQAFIESGHSKILVYRKTTDDIIGYCHSSSLFNKPKRIEDILTPIITVPETTLANDLMIQFINEHKSLALVMDEFGGTAGIVSMEDIIEEIFGEIEDEHDEDDLIEQKLSDDTYLLSGRLEIDYLIETYGWKLPSGDYDTLGGLILAYTDDFPRVGEIVKVDSFIFTVQAIKDNRVATIKMTIQSEPLEE